MNIVNSREPLAIRGAIVALATALLHLAVMAGFLRIPDEVEAQAALALDLLGTAVLVVWTRGKVTPVDAPRSDDGTPLVPADTTCPPPAAPRGDDTVLEIK